MLEIKTLLNDMYLRDTSRKIKTTIQTKRSMGEYTPKQPPFGYVKSKTIHNHLEIDPYAAEVVRRIYRMYQNGFGCTVICRTLNEDEIPCPAKYKKEVLKTNYVWDSGKGLWTSSTVSGILKNPVYTGAVVIRKHERPSYKLKYKKAIPLEEMELVPDAHEAIISKEEFDRVQQIRKGRRVSYFDKNNEPHKYVGLLFCGKCKTAMRKRYLASHKDYDGYMCGFHQKQGQNYCELNHITFEKLDELVVFAINQQLKQMKMDMKNLETQIRQKQPELDGKIAKLQAKIERNLEYRKRAYEQFMDEVLSKEEYLELKQMYETENVLNELDNMNEFEHISFTDQVNYMYEYVKFMDIAGRPILSQVVDQFLNVLEKKEGDELVDSFGTELEYKEQVIYLHLLRSYRELAEWEKYEACHEKIKDAYLDYDNKQFLYACDCRKQLFRFQAEKLAGMLDSWNLVNGDMYWPLVKANMYALIGEISKADAILSDVLTLVRKQLVKASGNEYLSSIEESIVSLINFIRQGNIVDETEECIHESDVSWWNENDKYCLYLNTEEKGNKSFETKDNFDLSSTYTMHMGRDNSNVFYALEYLRFLEQTGHPFRLQNVTNTKGLHSTVKLLAPYYPHWCLMQILIAQDNKHMRKIKKKYLKIH